VPPELVFDQGLGDLFTVRSAGEVLDEAVLGSVEYAVAHAGVPLVVVLGHSGCGAVKAAVDAVHGNGHAEGNVAALVQDVEPAVRTVAATSEFGADDDTFVQACVAEQTRRVATAMTDRSSTIRAAVESKAAAVVPAVYDLATGKVSRTDT
jgi:carbonic anhydrase